MVYSQLMNEKIQTNENFEERILTAKEVLDQFNEIITEDYQIYRSLENKDGLYLLEVGIKDAEDELILYTYIRAGSYPEGSSTETAIEVVFFLGDMPVGGNSIKKYKKGVWVPEVT